MAYNKETGMREGYIYKIVNDVNDKVYIGQTRRTIEERWKQHNFEAKQNRDNMIIHHAMMKYGIDKFYCIKIETIKCLSLDRLIEKLNNKEKEYIKTCNSIRPNGYNISIGGNVLDFNKIEIEQYDLCCNYINSFNSITEASNILGIPRASIEQCLNKS